MPNSPELTPLRSASIFEPEGDALVPTGLAAGPWYRGTQHGSAMLGLLARAVERHPSDVPRQVTRLTCDLMRAAPMAPVRTRSRTLRPGRSVEIVEAMLLAGDDEMARAVATRFRRAEVDVSGESTPGPEPPALPDVVDLRQIFGEERRVSDEEAFHQSLEMRPLAGFERPVVWFRSRVPLVAGETTTPLQKVATVADFTYSVPFMFQMARDPKIMTERAFVAINPDTSLNLHRSVEGDWICLDGSAHYDAGGAGTALARVFDQQGALGHASQSILLRGPEARPDAWVDPAAG